MKEKKIILLGCLRNTPDALCANCYCLFSLLANLLTELWYPLFQRCICVSLPFFFFFLLQRLNISVAHPETLNSHTSKFSYDQIYLFRLAQAVSVRQ